MRTHLPVCYSEILPLAFTACGLRLPVAQCASAGLTVKVDCKNCLRVLHARRPLWHHAENRRS